MACEVYLAAFDAYCCENTSAKKTLWSNTAMSSKNGGRGHYHSITESFSPTCWLLGVAEIFYPREMLDSFKVFGVFLLEQSRIKSLRTAVAEMLSHRSESRLLLWGGSLFDLAF